jgi:hypothetical protein
VDRELLPEKEPSKSSNQKKASLREWPLSDNKIMRYQNNYYSWHRGFLHVDLDNNCADKFSWEAKWNRNQQRRQDVKDSIIAEKLQRKALDADTVSRE